MDKTIIIYIIFATLIIITILISAIFSARHFKKADNMSLWQGREKNSDSNLTEALVHLKVTNMWDIRGETTPLSESKK